MKKVNFKSKLITIITIALLITSASVLVGTANAQELPDEIVIGPAPAGVTDDMKVPTEIILMVRPNPVGLNQIFLVNIWTVRAPGAGRAFLGYEVTITKPSGAQTVFTIDSYVADGTAWFEWIADEVGDWTLQVTFPGNFFPAGDYSAAKITHQDEEVTANTYTYNEPVYAEPSASPVITLTVQQDFVPVWPESELPTDYWTRPVASENREWWTILGNYPWFGTGDSATWEQYYPNTNPYPAITGSAINSDYGFYPWTEAPDTGHIVWKRMDEMGGLIGGDAGHASDIFWSPDWYDRPTVILNGRCYETVTRPAADGPEPQTYWQCYDLRTGEIFWERPLYAGETEPRLIEYAPSPYTFTLGAAGIEGVVPKMGIPSLMSISGGRLLKYDPVNGQVILNESISPMTGSGGTYYMNGYVLGVQNLGGGNYRLINWTTIGSANDFTHRVVSNTTYARNNLPSRIDWNVGLGANIINVDVGGIRWGQTIQSFDLTTGEMLWEKTVEAPQFSGSAALADHGKIVIGSMYGYFLAYDLRTGDFEWQTETMDYPWDITGWGSYGMISCYGNFYWGAPSSYYAFNWETGETVWQFQIPADFPFETAYGTGTDAENSETVYPFHAPGLAADGKIFVYSLQHSPEPPYFRGQPMLAIDAFTGELVWKLGGFTGCGQHTKTAIQMRIADGYLALGSRDGYMYVIGKGKSETTVTAGPKALAKGSTVLIEGTVLDLSPAQPGTPCVSKESMEVQMQYLHLQMPIDGIHHNVTLTGVPVTLTAVSPSGQYVDIGTATSEGYYGTFGMSWTPTEEGTYQIIAAFAGDDSYGSSGASTYVTVGPAASAGGTITPEQPSSGGTTTPTEPTPEEPTPEQPTPEQPTPEEPEPTVPEHPLISAELAIIIAVVAACIIGAVAYVALRRRK